MGKTAESILNSYTGPRFSGDGVAWAAIRSADKASSRHNSEQRRSLQENFAGLHDIVQPNIQIGQINRQLAMLNQARRTKTITRSCYNECKESLHEKLRDCWRQLNTKGGVLCQY